MKVIKLLFLAAVLAPLLYLFSIEIDAFLSKPDIKKNPNPKKRYEITLTINDAPGPFDEISGFSQYSVNDRSCVPITGAPLNPLRIPPETQRIKIDFRRVAGSVYRGYAYLDGIINEDYFGLGVCQWSMTAITAVLRTGNLTLAPSLSPDEIFLGKEVPTYFDRGNYQRNQLERSTFGRSDPSKYKPELQDSLFSITLSARKAF